jgi:hypothetical protein
MSKPKKKRPQHGNDPNAAEQQERQASPSAEKLIKIYYAESETGPAEVLGGLLARVIDVPVLTDRFWRDDIVQLTHLPTDGLGFPRIARVVHTRHECRSALEIFCDEYGTALLMHLFRLLGADSAVILPSRKGKPGILSVAHLADLDPAAVVKLIGAQEADGEANQDHVPTSTEGE